MQAPDTEMFYLQRGALTAAGGITLTTGAHELDEQDVPNTFLYTRGSDGHWKIMLQEWGAVSLCALTDGIMVVGEDGDFLQVDTQHRILAQGVIEGSSPRAVAQIGETVFLAGMCGDFYRYEARGGWSKQAFESPFSRDVEAIAGIDAEDFYSVGWTGGINRHIGSVTAEIEPLTNLVLASVCVNTSGRVYACGQRGVILSGQEDEWKVVCADSTEEDLWSISAFRDEIYVASITSLYRLDGDSLIRVDFDGEPVASCYHLSTLRDERLLSTGREDVMVFDGSAWERVV